MGYWLCGILGAWLATLVIGTILGVASPSWSIQFKSDQRYVEYHDSLFVLRPAKLVEAQATSANSLSVPSAQVAADSTR